MHSLQSVIIKRTDLHIVLNWKAKRRGRTRVSSAGRNRNEPQHAKNHFINQSINRSIEQPLGRLKKDNPSTNQSIDWTQALHMKSPSFTSYNIYKNSTQTQDLLTENKFPNLFFHCDKCVNITYRSSDDPTFPWNEFWTSHWQIAHFKRFHHCLQNFLLHIWHLHSKTVTEIKRILIPSTNLGFIVPDVNLTIVQAGQHPRLRGMEVHALDAIRPAGQLPLDIQTQRL